MSPKTCACGSRARCIDSRETRDIWRRRYQCPACGSTWTTVEERMEMRISKKRGKGVTKVLCGLREAEREAIRLELQPYLDAIKLALSNR